MNVDTYPYMGFNIPVDLMWQTGLGPDSFAAISAAHFAQLKKWTPIKSDHSVLEVGCGIGRDAIPRRTSCKRGAISGSMSSKRRLSGAPRRSRPSARISRFFTWMCAARCTIQPALSSRPRFAFRSLTDQWTGYSFSRSSLICCDLISSITLVSSNGCLILAASSMQRASSMTMKSWCQHAATAHQPPGR